jgi:triacylglycerol lipase
MPPVRLYLSPGMFGFAQLAAYDYFEHVARALRTRFRQTGREVEVRVVEVHPTASIRRRATKLMAMVAHTSGTDEGPIHLLGHSTGGLDARMVASPSVHLSDRATQQNRWLSRLRSVTTISTPHYGTPLATFFATAKGQRLLYSVSAITVTALKLGSPPLAAASALVAALGRTGESVGVELALVDSITDSVARMLDDAASRDLRGWLRQVRDDQGAVVQLMPEAMDLFEAGVEDRPNVRYQCVASYAPPSGLGDWMRNLRSPWAMVSAALFHLMYRVTAQKDERYPCAPDGGRDAEIESVLGAPVAGDANDGVVPLSSQLWGTPIWIGKGDHLDMVGHFPGPEGHNDWLTSGARFDMDRFDIIMDRVFEGMLESEGIEPEDTATEDT